MDPFKKHTGVAVPFDQADVDTDLIIPARYLKRIDRRGYGEFLFYSKRFRGDGTPDPDFVLNRPQFWKGTVLVAGRNFGCGSSREHAPWALQDYGFKAIVAPSFADIFANNSAQVGLLTIVLPEERVRQILDTAASREGYQVTIDLQTQTVTDGFGHTDTFEIDAFKKHCLLNGLDAIGLTLQHEAAITRFESGRPTWMPRVTP